MGVLYNNMIDNVMLASTILRNKDIARFYGVSLPTAIKIKRAIIDDMRASGELSPTRSSLCVYHLAMYERVEVLFVVEVLCSTGK